MASRVAVIGAGPQGLSIAAHLNARGLQPLVFGRTMEFWRRNMPPGMKLISDAAECDLTSPDGDFTLERFCAARGLPDAQAGAPVALETFLAYGEAFQRHSAPQVDARYVSRLAAANEGFQLTLEDGAQVEAGAVVLAVGLGASPRIPAAFARISGELVSHSSTLNIGSTFAGKRVLVVGAGASATDCALALANAGSDVTLVFRARHLDWASRRASRSPQLFSRLPAWARVALVERAQRPTPNPHSREALERHVRILPGREILGVQEMGSEVEVELGRIGAQIEYFRADHVVLATGYHVDLNRLSLITPEVRSGIEQIHGSPRLSSNFESSVPGLYFAGALSAYSFGPSMRLVRGAAFAAPRIAAAIEQSLGSRSAPGRAVVYDRPNVVSHNRVGAVTRRAV